MTNRGEPSSYELAMRTRKIELVPRNFALFNTNILLIKYGK